MTTTEKFNDYKVIHNFMYPDEKLKSWINEDNYINHFVDDWGSLMEVVEKIERIEDTDFIVYINVECCKITARETYPDLLIINTARTKIEATYNSCVEFINWYNQQKLN